MKSYILFAILIGLGASQILVTPNICGCTQLTNQHDCQTLPGCQWQTDKCQTNCIQLPLSQCLEASHYCYLNQATKQCQSFSQCSDLEATTPQQCTEQNVRCLGYGQLPNQTTNSCLFYYQITSTCSDYTSNTCNYNFGQDGPCLWSNNNNICQVYTKCASASSRKQCQYLNYYTKGTIQGILCQWSGTACIDITSCGQFTKDTCKFYFSQTNPGTFNIKQTILNACVWQSSGTDPETGSCVPVTKLSNLTETNCLSNTGFFFRWYGSQNNPAYGICGPCKQVSQVSKTYCSRTQCQCSDYILKNDCTSQDSLCQWNPTTQTCSANQCQNIQTQNICITVANCYWSFNQDSCQPLTSCTELTYKASSVGCAAQSLQCAGYEQGGSCSLTSNIVSTCKGQQSLQTCSQFISSQGLCVWNTYTNSCSLLQYCNQIHDPVICGSWQNQCLWDAAALSCQQMTCSLITNEKHCTFILTEFQETQYQLCRWNKSLGLLGGCENAYSTLLQTSQTCVSNTGNTFRWSTNNAPTGMCVSCGTNQLLLQTPSSCQCSQLYSQDNCNNSGFCTFNTTLNSCQPSPCSNYQNQITCASLSTCYWNSKNSCQPFTNCSSLQATNQLECVNMNASCKGFSNGTCQSFPTQTCTAMYTATQSCYNNIGTDGVCFSSTTGQTTSCIGFSQCNQANETLCLRNQLSCQWNTTTNKCSQVSCSSFQTQINCKFYLPNPLSSQVIPCLWNTTSKTCGAASNILTQLTQNNCAASTHNTYSWVTVSTNKGYCVRCQEQVTLPNQCTCSFLSQFDCSQALECFWNNGSCQLMKCTQIIQQTVCASQTGCQWNNNSCSDFNGQCSNLIGSSQAECMGQNVQCVGSNGKNCNNSYNKCEANTQDTQCVASLGSDGACHWNSPTTKCIAVNTCNQLPESACKLRSKSCYWNTTSCQTLTCSALYTQFNQCTFVMNLSQKNKVQACQMINNVCTSIPDPLNLTQDQCFTNTNRTARWVPNISGQGGICYSCSAIQTPLFAAQTYYSAQTCQCYQYMTQNDCLGAPTQSCVWANNKCTQNSCTNILSNLDCASSLGCGWNSTTKTCENFTSCTSINAKGLAIQNCLSYSIKCQGYNGTTCTQYPNYTCGSLTTPSTCSGNLGTDGACLWNTSGSDTGSCIAITTCNQITNQSICNYYSNICHYQNQQCQQLTCGSYTSPASCTFIYTNFSTGDIQQCQWSANSCSNLTSSSQLNSLTCSANTAFTYRWYLSKNENGQGYCTKCVLNTLYVPGQCACNQLIYQNDCQANLQCSWSAQSPPSCYNKPCSSIPQQAACSVNPRCSWSAAQQLCQPFQSCSDLAGINAGECASYSIFCAAVSKTYLPLQQKYICSPTASQQCSVQTPAGTSGTTTASECENTYVAYGICQYNSTTKQCTKITQCSEITSPLRCQQLIHSCYWQLPTAQVTTASCVATTCSQITNKLECTYVLSSLATPSASNVTQCLWQPSNGCVQASNILKTLTSSNCYSNTLMMSRWTSTSADTGYCATCNYQTLQTSVLSPCSCKSLSSYECNIASPQCSYNSTSLTCSNSICSSITSMYSCAANPNCIYIGTCQKYTKSPSSSTTYGCVNITSAATAFDCYTASVNCPQFIPSATKGNSGTCGIRQQCSQFNSTACATYNSQVAAEYCVWNNNECQNINNCKQITDVALCSLQTNRCQWSVIFNSCITQSCNSYTSQSECTYVYTSYSPGDVALCYWDPLYNDCRSTSLSYAETYNQANTTQCFVNTGHVYHLDGTDCTRCFQNILSILLITVLLILI